MKKIIIILIAVMLFSCNLNEKTFNNCLDFAITEEGYNVPAGSSFIGTPADYQVLSEYYVIETVNPMEFNITRGITIVQITLTFPE